MIGRRTCLRRGCTVLIDPAKFACDVHWLTVPLPVRVELVDALRFEGEHSERTGRAVAAVVDALRGAA